MVEWLDAPGIEEAANGQPLGRDHPHNPLVRRALVGDLGAHLELVERYESMAAIWRSWTDSHSDDYTLPLRSGLDHVRKAMVVELSAGGGAGTNVLLERGFDVIAVEPSAAMVAEFRSSISTPAVRATSDQLPFASDTIELLVGLNAVADADEMRRVLAPGGQILWCYSFGEATPVYIEPEELASAVGASRAFAQRAGQGFWLILEVEG